MGKEIIEKNIKAIKQEIELTEQRLDGHKKALLTATPDNVDQILKGLNEDASRLGQLELNMEEEQEQLKIYLTTFEVTIPTSVVEDLDFIVSKLQKKDKEINRNSVVSYLIQNYFVNEGYYDLKHDAKKK